MNEERLPAPQVVGVIMAQQRCATHVTGHARCACLLGVLGGLIGGVLGGELVGVLGGVLVRRLLELQLIYSPFDRYLRHFRKGATTSNFP